MTCKLNRFVLMIVVLIAASNFVQAQTINGKVVGKTGIGITDTYLFKAGTADSAKTDAEGIFSLKANKGDSIHIKNNVLNLNLLFVAPASDSILVNVKDNSEIEVGEWKMGTSLKDTITGRAQTVVDTTKKQIAAVSDSAAATATGGTDSTAGAVQTTPTGDTVLIKGKVVNNAGEPIASASIEYPNGTLYTADSSGNFSIPFIKNTKVRFSSVGVAAQEITLADSSQVLNVQLQKTSAEQLEEVTVTALGISKKSRSVGYAISEVKGSEIQTAKETNFVNNLAGRVAGVQISTNSGSMGGSTKVNIRGPKSIQGDNNALFIVDGIPFSNLNTNSINQQIGGGGFDYGNPIQDINPDDIDQISVLKGAAATALYGSRGQNGVVLVTTKKSAGAKKFGVNYSLNVQSDKIYILPDYQNLYGGGSDGQFDTLWYNDNPDYFLSEGAATYDDPTRGPYDLMPEFSVDESWGPKLDGSLVRHYWSFDKNKGNPDFGVTAPWAPQPNNVRDFFQPGFTMTNSISMGGSNDRGSIRIAFADTRQRFVLPNSKLSRTNAGINGTYKITDDLIVSSGVRYAYTEAKGRPGTGFTGQNMMMLFSEYGQRQWDMDRMSNYKRPDGSQISWNRRSFSNDTLAFSNNPYWTRYEEFQTDNRSRVFGSLGLDYTATDWLTLSTKVFMDAYNTLQEERSAKDYLPGGYIRNTIDFREMNYLGTANIRKDLSEKFNINVTVGGNIMRQEAKLFTGSTTTGLGSVGVYTLANSLGPVLITELNPRKQINSLFGTATIGFTNSVFLELSGRNDWSSSLLKNGKPRPYFYPSASTSIIFSDWIKDAKWLSFGKIRAGIAQVGNDTDPYNLFTVYQAPTQFNGQSMTGIDPTKRNPDLLPEMSTEKEGGIELKMFDNRFGLDFTYYDRITKNQIISIPVSQTTGYTNSIINLGKISNKGIELRVEGTPLRTKSGFTWNIAVNLSKNKNKVLDLAQNGQEITDRIVIGQERRLTPPVALVAVKGQPLGSLYGFDYAYDNQGRKIIDSAGLYQLTGTTVPLGSVYPDLVGGITNSFTFKNISLRTLVDFSKGGKFFSYTNMYGKYSGLLAETAESGIRENGVPVSGVVEQPDGSYAPYSVDVPAKTYYQANFGRNNNIHSANVYDASYVYLREVTLGYQLPQSWSEKINSDNITLSLYGRNLWLIKSNAPNVDPSNITNGSGNIQGLEGGALPSVRSYGLNLNIAF
ncbi:SusC/RagA family TonB-linked outer membrane protein [Niabella ginsengisoli]|uniref:SusC/RagA family TonB-linked outer membrane protein n=1 Tax=Niabella ginsengisoli TaxID=522298 RepID=A0ABS9SGF5_9BACT|nr:SusC/RagA family TonB-linked outer membrane protein [Niabella ginsengisoli]MCH5597446.1 SusC/RagA family TonB-linked outer membrane protein [Niabella ginsengisoli]